MSVDAGADLVTPANDYCSKECTMLYEFKSRATGTITMTQPIAEMLLDAMEHPKGKTGVITVEQLPAAIKALELLSDEESAPPAEASEDDNDDEQEAPIAISKRAFPLVEMMRESLAAGKPVTWGV